MGDGIAGTVMAVASSVSRFKPGDKVFGFGWRNQAEKAHQLYSVVTQNILGKLPEGFTMQQAVTVPNNFVTVYHTFTYDFGFDLPWPKPEVHKPKEIDHTILVWGGSSSCGMYAIQLLRHFGYTNIITTASKSHHTKLQRYGAAQCFDYRTPDVAAHIRQHTTSKGAPLKFVLDCIGSFDNSIVPISKVATEPGTKVAILLPVIIRDAAEEVTPIYSFDVIENIPWAAGVEARGVRTHFYTNNDFLAQNLQPVIMPAALEQGIIEPNDQTIVEGASLLDRAEKALGMLRRKEVSGSRLVWRVAEDHE